MDEGVWLVWFNRSSTNFTRCVSNGEISTDTAITENTLLYQSSWQAGTFGERSCSLHHSHQESEMKSSRSWWWILCEHNKDNCPHYQHMDQKSCQISTASWQLGAFAMEIVISYFYCYGSLGDCNSFAKDAVNC